MLPSVTISKPVFTSASSANTTTGILAICAASATGTVNQPAGFSRSDLALTAFGLGPLVDMGAYDLAVSNNPVILVKTNPTFPGSYNGLNTSGVTGAAVVTTSGTPLDRYAPIVLIGNGGTVGVAGITYTYSLDGGQNFSGVQALGTATSIAIPNSGVVFNLTSATLNANDTWLCFTERPLANDSDVLASLGALFQTRLPFEGALVDCSATSSTVGLVDTFLAGQEGNGVFKFVLLNTRFKTEPEPTAESEAAYATALEARFGTSTSIRVCMGADGAHVPSQITGLNLKRPTSMFLGARAMSTPIGTDAAYVALGPINGAQIANSQGNPADHDEDLFPDLDDLRFVTMRSFAAGGPQGCYITNANTMQPDGGSYPYLQHIRIMNVACTVAWQVLSTQLSRGVRKNPKADPVTGAVYIFEPDASAIESLVNDALTQPMKGQVSAVEFSLSRTDNLNVVPTVVTGILSIVAMAYIKGYAVTAEFTKTLTVAT